MVGAVEKCNLPGDARTTRTRSPVVQIIHESAGEVVSTPRIRGTRSRTQVFRRREYITRLARTHEDRLNTSPGLFATGDNREVTSISF